ncbi:T9SS type B sorting domain-containing protein [Flavobacterium sp. W22_SRS_FP1]|uniref:T9SS type B sorting domain-containing protein n=1 Tax=Flavobacterium sp. W22_SRS_FP1 TaxID=3240276 RepID=UPI003F8FDB67
MKNAILIFFTFLSISCFAQFSKTHYIPPLTAQNNLAEDQFIYISTPSNADVIVKIIEIGGNTITRVVTNSKPEIYPIGQGNDSRLFIPKASTGKVSNKGYIIEADDLIYVSVRVNAGFSTLNNSYNHAGGLVSKGNSALGKVFRLGAMLNPLYDNSLLNFASILSTENNTAITISNIPDGTVLSNGTIISGAISITLNKNESYVLALENDPTSTSNSSKMIGALVQSDKPVVVNSGSFCGSNSTAIGNVAPGIVGPIGRDVGFDQIVPFEKTGTEYIFVKGAGTDELERVILIAHKPNTIIKINDIFNPFITLINAGDYVAIEGSQFSNGNLYVSSSEKVFAYQCIGGNSTVYSPPANQNMFFVPPLNCATPNTVDNIPYIEQIGNINYTDGSLNIVTETGATVLINGDPVTTLPIAVDGKSTFERYSIPISTGNIAVKSSKQVYVSFYSSNGAATYGGYYSGFDTKPEITSEISIGTTSSCIPNVILKVSSITAYDTFEWSFNGEPISNSNSNSYIPTQPGYYEVKGSITGCDSFYSDKIPVSNCPTNIDNDLANDNIDIDNDNDGITNCTESYGNQNIDLSNSTVGTVAVGTYSNSFTGFTSTNGTGLPTGTFTGGLDGSFVTEILAGKDNSVTYKMTFAQPISLAVEYATTASASDLLNANAEYIINSDIDKTITVLNPDDQLLIDTNYDGIYESGVTEFSSFEIRFRLKSTTSLPAGTGTFKFLTYLTNTIRFTHKNLSDDTKNKSSFKFFAVCIPKDSDRDGISDQLDSDSDNDGILDAIEAQAIVLARLNADTNNDGLDNAFEPGLTPVDTDGDGITDYLDLDSDNDGILDSVETGIDTDSDGIRNYRDLDSDNDLCNDVIESGFTDPDGDGKFGNLPISVDPNGLVSGAPYTIPDLNYTISAPIVITTQPDAPPTCESKNATITIDANGDSYQWQLSTDGTTWTDISNTAPYSNATTNTLTITSVTNAMDGFKYRVQLNKTGNSCGWVSEKTTLTVYPLPVVNPVTIIQCDDDSDLKTFFNLTVKNDVISNNFINENFTYYTSQAQANNPLSIDQISTPLAFENINPPLPALQGIMDVWARVANKITGCFSIAKLTLTVAASKIPPTYNYIVPPVCDDTLAADGTATADPNTNKRDGISAFDLTNAINDVESQLPPPLSNYTFKYYRNKADALAQNDVVGNSLAIKPSEYTNFRNDIPNSQNIWVRVNNNLTSDCGDGFGDFIKLSVEKLPFANPVSIPRQCDDNQDGIFNFNTTTLESTLLGSNQTYPVTVTYYDAANNPLKDANGVLITSPFPSTFITSSQTIKAVVINNTAQSCFDETTIQFIVDDLPQAFAVPAALTTTCDDEINPLVQDGKMAFDTSTFQNTILNGQTGMIVTYTLQNGTVLATLAGTFTTETQNVLVTVTNPLNPSCPATTTLNFIVNPLPRININANGDDDELVCSNLPTFFVKLDAGIQDNSPTSNYTYLWSKDGIVLPSQIAYELDVNTEGTYTVDVKNISDCSRIRTIKVTASDVARITDITIVDLTDINSVTVNVTGSGKYEYSLDDPYGPFQSSNFFDNVPAGIHEVFVNDENGCGITSQSIAILGAPKFFTPNGDGFNDFWNIKGVNANFNSKSVVYIFDRYGKLITKIDTNSEGWDGTFNGQPLVADDYWYAVRLEDGREAKGHFSLKR